MNVQAIKYQIQTNSNLLKATAFVTEQLNLYGMRGDFDFYEESYNEVVLRNHTACPTFCTKKEACDVRFCQQHQKTIQKGLSFIDDKLELANTKCANSGDSYCEVRITFSP